MQDETFSEDLGPKPSRKRKNQLCAGSMHPLALKTKLLTALLTFQGTDNECHWWAITFQSPKPLDLCCIAFRTLPSFRGTSLCLATNRLLVCTSCFAQLIRHKLHYTFFDDGRRFSVVRLYATPVSGQLPCNMSRPLQQITVLVTPSQVLKSSQLHLQFSVETRKRH